MVALFARTGRLAVGVLAALATTVVAAPPDLASVATRDTPCGRPDYQHGISYVVPLKYDTDFEHFAYANPDAPKAGRIRFPVMGTFDSFNNILEKGRLAAERHTVEPNSCSSSGCSKPPQTSRRALTDVSPKGWRSTPTTAGWPSSSARTPAGTTVNH